MRKLESAILATICVGLVLGAAAALFWAMWLVAALFGPAGVLGMTGLLVSIILWINAFNYMRNLPPERH